MATVAQWVRLALTGDPDSTKPASGTITMLEAGAGRELINQYPSCLDGAPDSLSGADLDAFTEALGYRVAAGLVLTPGGAQYVRHVLSLKQGTVGKTFSDPGGTPQEAQRVLVDASAAALSRIGCVREALANTPQPSLLTLAGRRRSSSCGCR